MLVPIDLSEVSFAAWDQAREISKFFSASIEVVHVMAPGLSNSRKEAAALIRARIGMDAKLHVLSGDPIPLILRLIEDLGPHLVVMGTHGRTGIRRFVLGSVAESVIRDSPVPVLTVRNRFRQIRSVLVPVTSSHYSISGFAMTLLLAFDLRAKVTALHVVGSAAKTVRPSSFLMDLIRRLHPEVRRVCDPGAKIANGVPEEEILSEAPQHDLVALVSHRQSPLADWVAGTTLERVLKRCPVPILSIPYIDPESSRRADVIDKIFPRKL